MLQLLAVAALLLAGCAGKASRGGEQTTISSKVQFVGGTGESTYDAVIINGIDKQSEGLDAEYHYISQKHGIKNKDWSVIGQTIVKEKDKIFDVIEIRLGGGDGQRIYYFDVTSFPWKKK